MTITINETRFLTIKERIITLENVMSLAKILNQERLLVSDDSKTELSFSARCTDNSSFNSQELTIFDKDSPLSRKRVDRIQIEFRNYATKSLIAIDIEHGNNRWGNSVKVKGTDSTWVNGTLKVIEETIDSFTPQNTFLYKNEKTIRAIFSLGLGSLYMWAIRLIPTSPQTEAPEWAIKLYIVLNTIPLGYYIFKYVMAFAVGWLPSEILYKKLKALWPSIELQIGPEHSLTEVQRRKWVANAFVLGILPFITSAIYDLLKGI